jgi:catechol-2,3-dioxygenase
MVTVRRLNHAVLYVRDSDEAAAFYQDLLGMEVVDRFPGQAAFLRSPKSGNHHDVGLFSVGRDAPAPPRGSTGLYHLAWEVDTIEDLAALRRALLEAGSLTGQSDHGVSKSLYAKDPSGNEFEVLWVVPRESWGELEHAAPVMPLDLEAEVARWGAACTA